MSTLTFKKGALATSIAVALAGVPASVAFAAEEAAANQDDKIEVIEVRGIRGSLKANLNAKRFSDAVVDVINAEDIGKFPDKNVAESLQRVPGITIQRQFGEGSSVSIRGAGQNLTKTTLNGQNVASTGWFVLEPAKRSFNYELLPSELVGGLEVYKSSQADISEGGIGGTVVVNTRTPLKLDSNTAYASIEAQYSDDSEETDPQFSGMYSWKNDEETFGFLVSAVAQERHLQRQGNEAFWQWGAGPVGFEQNRKRNAFTVALEWAPTENLSFVLNAMDMEMEADNTNFALWLTQADTTWGGGQTDEFIAPGSEPGQVGTPVKGPLNVAYYQARPREATMNSDLIDLKTTYEGEAFTLEVQVGTTESDGGTDFEMVVDDGTGGTPIPGGTYDFTGGTQKWDTNGFDIATYDPGSLAMGTGANFNATPKTDEETYFQADVEFQVEDWGIITAVKTGFRYADHNTTSRKFEFNQADGFNNVISTSGLAQGSYDVGLDNLEIMKFDVAELKKWAKNSITGKTEDLGAYSEIQEDNTAAYVMAKYEGENYRGNFGVRYIQTDAESIYYVDGVKSSTKADYSEVLPSVNFAYNLEEDLILRLSAARTIARPQYNDMYVNPSPLGVNDDTPNNQIWVAGNVALEPYKADQFDIGLEWYFNENSLISGAVFAKKVDNFVKVIETQNVPASEIPLQLPPEEAAFGWTTQTKENAEDADILGFEFQYQQDFGNGFGTMVNYTYTDTETDDLAFSDQNPFLTDASDHTYNLTGYYETDDFYVRLSYNWRSEYMLRESGAYGNRLHDDFGSLDLSAVYNFNENITFKVDVVNMTGEESKQYGNNQQYTHYSGFADGFPVYQYAVATRINAGVSFKF
ncbi:TonB-dependent receptor [Thalassotalea sp. M1531]|uniref:TonB-dependent receptor n=1 Tax=Thalassotalea algicola TaxID=2716224 RepID=A0A7Y0LBY1_9GAMM|nr:TonB-dependent receptor [Thalassotalea algicola]NMP30280.1 TonB-dependent receptor [Thalassotalea algicola]